MWMSHYFNSGGTAVVSDDCNQVTTVTAWVRLSSALMSNNFNIITAYETTTQAFKDQLPPPLPISKSDIAYNSSLHNAVL